MNKHIIFAYPVNKPRFHIWHYEERKMQVIFKKWFQMFGWRFGFIMCLSFLFPGNGSSLKTFRESHCFSTIKY